MLDFYSSVSYCNNETNLIAMMGFLQQRLGYNLPGKDTFRRLVHQLVAFGKSSLKMASIKQERLRGGIKLNVIRKRSHFYLAHEFSLFVPRARVGITHLLRNIHFGIAFRRHGWLDLRNTWSWRSKNRENLPRRSLLPRVTRFYYGNQLN